MLLDIPQFIITKHILPKLSILDVLSLSEILNLKSPAWIKQHSPHEIFSALQTQPKHADFLTNGILGEILNLPNARLSGILQEFIGGISTQLCVIYVKDLNLLLPDSHERPIRLKTKNDVSQLFRNDNKNHLNSSSFALSKNMMTIGGLTLNILYSYRSQSLRIRVLENDIFKLDPDFQPLREISPSDVTLKDLAVKLYFRLSLNTHGYWKKIVEARNSDDSEELLANSLCTILDLACGIYYSPLKKIEIYGMGCLSNPAKLVPDFKFFEEQPMYKILSNNDILDP